MSGSIPHPKKIPPRVYAIVSTMFVVAAVISLSDVTISETLVRWDWPSDLRKLISLSETFSHGVGVAVILIVIFCAAPELRQKMWRLASCPIAAGIAANIAKLLVARYRPQYFYQQLPPDADMNVASTFSGWIPIVNSAEWKNHLTQSFPSAHTTTAFALAVALGWAFPRGRVVFFILAILAGIQRIESQSHWPSDVAFGAALGTLVGVVICYSKLGESVFAQFERKTDR